MWRIIKKPFAKKKTTHSGTKTRSFFGRIYCFIASSNFVVAVLCVSQQQKQNLRVCEQKELLSENHIVPQFKHEKNEITLRIFFLFCRAAACFIPSRRKKWDFYAFIMLSLSSLALRELNYGCVMMHSLSLWGRCLLHKFPPCETPRQLLRTFRRHGRREISERRSCAHIADGFRWCWCEFSASFALLDCHILHRIHTHSTKA